MNFLSRYRHKYYLHQAYSRHPKLSFATDLAKTASFAGLIAMIGWFTYSLTTNQSDSTLENISQLAELGETTNPVDNKNELLQLDVKVEIPAAASTVEPSNVPATTTTGTTKSTLAAAQKKAAVTESLSVSDQKIIYTSGWVSRLPADKYIIQVASSTDRELLLKDALAFPYGPVAIYPFNKSKRKRVIYGLSAGVYNSFDDARRAIDILPKEVVANGPWIRQISTVKKQIQNLSVDS